MTPPPRRRLITASDDWIVTRILSSDRLTAKFPVLRQIAQRHQTAVKKGGCRCNRRKEIAAAATAAKAYIVARDESQLQEMRSLLGLTQNSQIKVISSGRSVTI